VRDTQAVNKTNEDAKAAARNSRGTGRLQSEAQQVKKKMSVTDPEATIGCQTASISSCYESP
jgi:hypothetical protein